MPEPIIAHCQKELFALYVAITKPAAARIQAPAPSTPPVALSDDDAALLTIGRQRLGPVFGRLVDGDRGDYGDLSDADNGIIKDLLKLTGRDAERTERILRGLPLHRDKWDSGRGGKTWLRYSIDRALEAGVDPLDSTTWTEHEPRRELGPSNGHCSPHCDRHYAVIESQKKVIAEQRAELDRLKHNDRASGKRLGELKRFRRTSAFSGKRKDIIEAIGFAADQARQLGKTEAPIYYGDRDKHKGGQPAGGIAEAAGVSPKSVAMAVEILRDAAREHPDLVPWRFPTYQDETTGVRRVKIVLDPDSTIEQDLARLADLPKAAAVRKEPLRCPDCPRAKLHVTKTCKSCGQVVAEYEERPPRIDPLVQTLDKAPHPSTTSVVPVPSSPRFGQGPPPESEPEAMAASSPIVQALDKAPGDSPAPPDLVAVAERIGWAEVPTPIGLVGGDEQRWRAFCTFPPPFWPEVYVAAMGLAAREQDGRYAQ
jgi:hypothetical protein